MTVQAQQWWLVEYDQQRYRAGTGRTWCKVVADNETDALTRAQAMVGRHNGIWPTATVTTIDGPDAPARMRRDQPMREEVDYE